VLERRGQVVVQHVRVERGRERARAGGHDGETSQRRVGARAGAVHENDVQALSLAVLRGDGDGQLDRPARRDGVRPG